MMRALILLPALALAACVSAGGETPAAPAPAAVVSTPAGEKLYGQHCLACHQSDGGGVPNMQPAITGGSWVTGDPAALALFVLTGGFNSAERKDSVSHNVMPPFRQLADGDLAEILSYIRGKFGNGAAPVSAAQVAAARASQP
jgi:mono/diheme cytochrome c family protein